jgi:hypothetical protein
VETTRKPPLEPALRAETARAERRLTEHPSPETLVAYEERRLPGVEREHLRDHLALCTDCAALLLDLIALSETDTPAEAHGPAGPADADMDTAWHALQARLGEMGEIGEIGKINGIGEREAPPAGAPASTASNVVRMPRASSPAVAALAAVPAVAAVAAVPAVPPVAAIPAIPAAARRKPTSWAWALAASWLAVAGLGFWVFELRQENARLEEPAVNAVIVDLAAEGEQVRGGERESVKLSSAGGHAFLDVDAAGLPVHPDYEVEILSGPGTGRTLWTGRHLKRSQEDHFSLDLSSGFLSPGPYRLRLFGVEEGRREKLADYPFVIQSP